MLRLVIKQLHLLHSLVNDILDVHMIGAGRFEPKISVFDPNEAFEFVIKMFCSASEQFKTKM